MFSKSKSVGLEVEYIGQERKWEFSLYQLTIILFAGPDGEAAEILQTDCPTQDHEEIISDGNVHKEVVIEEDVIEDGQDSDKQFKVFWGKS